MEGLHVQIIADGRNYQIFQLDFYKAFLLVHNKV
jgi:hypothetical protein